MSSSTMRGSGDRKFATIALEQSNPSVKRIAVATILLLAGLLGILYAGDYALLRYRVASAGNAFGSVAVSSYYAVQEKNNKTEYIFKNQENQTCVHSLFSHLGYVPCWYLNRHTERQITI